MVNIRLRSIIRKEFIQIIRDPRTLILVIAIPIMQLLMMGYAATTDVRNVPLAIFDQDRGPEARALLDAYRAADYFRLAYDVDSLDEILSLIDRGDAKAGLIIPPDYNQQMAKEGTAQIAFVLDGSDPTIASTSLSAAQLIAQAHATDVMAERLARTGQGVAVKTPLEVRTQVWYNPDMLSAYFMVPGVIGMILYSITSILTATAVVRERERGTIEQLIVTPIRSWELIVGKILPYAVLALIDTVEVLALGSWLFGVPIRSGLGLVMLLSGLCLLTGLGIGLLVSTVANTQQEATLTTFTTLLPSIFLSGFFFPVEAMPRVLQWISYLIPLRYYLTVIRSLLIKGVGVDSLQKEILALAIFGVAFILLAALRLKKRLE
ncbi:MAG: ABC transporter permease [Anaerolineales bacterium]|nr:ABC transporter permease [Anaerolineales bacterium]